MQKCNIDSKGVVNKSAIRRSLTVAGGRLGAAAVGLLPVYNSFRSATLAEVRHSRRHTQECVKFDICVKADTEI